jgi:hypothetical protein
LICGTITALLVAGLFELHAFSGLDAALANFLARPVPKVFHPCGLHTGCGAGHPVSHVAAQVAT